MSRISIEIVLNVQPQSLVLASQPSDTVIEQGMVGTLILEVENVGPLPVTYRYVGLGASHPDIVTTLVGGESVRTVGPTGTDILELEVSVGKDVPAGDYIIGIDLN